ncbi:MAG: DinB family protein [Pyrinomonadaceae bacterium]
MTKEVLLKQFDSCYDKNVWFVSAGKALEGVSAEQAVWKPEGTDNSIWETLTHLTYYNNAYLQRFKGIDYEYSIADNDETFAAPDAPTEVDWNAEVAKFDSVMRNFRTLIENADESKFDQPVSEKNTASWAELISNINAHNAYHGGQILLIRKLQRAWNPKEGVS